MGDAECEEAAHARPLAHGFDLVLPLVDLPDVVLGGASLGPLGELSQRAELTLDA